MTSPSTRRVLLGACSLAVLLGGVVVVALRPWRATPAPAVLVGAPAAAAALSAPAVVGSLPTAIEPAATDAAVVVGEVVGVARRTDGRPLPGATVALYRAVTGWPEWRRERIAQALVGADGAFRFRAPVAHGLLVGVEHPQHVEQIVETVVGGPPVDVRLAPGFPLAGVIVTEAGAPVANARVAVEAAVGDDRRVRVAVTSSAGRYEFFDLEAGAARLVVRHPSWQPTTLPVVVIGAQQRVDVRLARPALAPLRGVVVAEGSRAPIADAVVELLPTNAQPGLADPHAVRTGADGSFTVAGLGRTVMRLVVRHPAHGAVVRTMPVGIARAPIDIELPARSAVVGTLAPLRGLARVPVGATLRLRDPVGQLGFAAVQPDGSFAFSGDFSPGVAELRVLGGACAFASSRAAIADLRIDETARTEVDLAIVPPLGVRGRVVDEAGAPVAGARITRAAGRSVRGQALADAAAQIDVTALPRQVVQLLVGDREEPELVTDADGAFVAAGMTQGAVGLRIAAPGRATVFVDMVVGGVAERAAVETIRMPTAARLRGTVQRDGSPFAGGLVAAYLDDVLQATTVTDGAGAWSFDDLPAGEYRLRARNPAQAVFGDGRNAVAAPRGGAPVALQLAPARLVRGQVVARDGRPLPGAAVSLRRSVGGSVVTGADGAFAIEAPEAVDQLAVLRPDRTGAVLAAAPLDGAAVRIEVDAPPTCTLVGVVTSLVGRRRVSAVMLRVGPADDDVDDAPRGQWLDLPDGELRWGGCPSGRVRIELWSEGHAPAVVVRELEAGKEHELGEIVLEPGAKVRGVVVGPDGKPVADAQILVGDEADFEVFEPSVRSGPDGAFAVAGVSGRSNRLVVRAAGFAPTAVDLELPRDVLAQQPVRVVLQQGATIMVAVDRSLTRNAGFVQVRRDGRLVANVEIDDLGVAAIANLPAGAYEVALLGDERVVKAVTLAPGALRANVALP